MQLESFKLFQAFGHQLAIFTKNVPLKILDRDLNTPLPILKNNTKTSGIKGGAIASCKCGKTKVGKSIGKNN